MSVHIISVLANSVVTGITGRPIVRDISFSQTVSCFEPPLKPGPVISESGCVQNIFSTPGICASLLQPAHDCDVPTHANEQTYHYQLGDVRF